MISRNNKKYDMFDYFINLIYNIALFQIIYFFKNRWIR